MSKIRRALKVIAMCPTAGVEDVEITGYVMDALEYFGQRLPEDHPLSGGLPVVTIKFSGITHKNPARLGLKPGRKKGYKDAKSLGTI